MEPRSHHWFCEGSGRDSSQTGRPYQLSVLWKNFNSQIRSTILKTLIHKNRKRHPPLPFNLELHLARNDVAKEEDIWRGRCRRKGKGPENFQGFGGPAGFTSRCPSFAAHQAVWSMGVSHQQITSNYMVAVVNQWVNWNDFQNLGSPIWSNTTWPWTNISRKSWRMRTMDFFPKTIPFKKTPW